MSGEMSPRGPPQLHLLIPKRKNTHNCRYRATDPLPTTMHRPTSGFYQKKPRMVFIPQKTHLIYYISNSKCIWIFFPGGFLPALVSKKLLWDTQHSCSVLLIAQHSAATQQQKNSQWKLEEMGPNLRLGSTQNVPV